MVCTDSTRQSVDKGPRNVWPHDPSHLAELLQAGKNGRGAIAETNKALDVSSDSILRDAQSRRLNQAAGVRHLQKGEPAAIASLRLVIGSDCMIGSRALFTGEKIPWLAGRLPEAAILVRPVLQLEAGALRGFAATVRSAAHATPPPRPAASRTPAAGAFFTGDCCSIRRRRSAMTAAKWEPALRVSAPA